VLSSEDKQVEVDACQLCHGIWLDAREAEQLFAITNEAHVQNARPGSSGGTAGIVAMYLVQLVTQVPIEVHHPLKRRPVLIYSLVAILIAIYGIEVFEISTGQIEPFLATWSLVPSTLTHGQHLWALITHAFLHGGLLHLVGNLYFLWAFGDNVEDRLGKARFTILYLVTAVIAGLTHYAGDIHSHTTMVGASGAIAGLMGAYFILFPRVKVWVMIVFYPLKVRAIWYLLFWVGMQFVTMLDKTSNVAWLAHVGGFASGTALGWLLKPRGEPLPQAPPAMRPH
jgi:membrane associated rhomboid family serine protease